MKTRAGPFKRMLSAVCGLAQTRLELIGIELAEEKERLLMRFCICLAMIVFAMLSLIAFTALVAAVFWESYRWQALSALTVLYFTAAVLCALKLRAGMRTAPPFLAATRAEFAKDCETLMELH